jgi:hypothetical protein
MQSKEAEDEVMNAMRKKCKEDEIKRIKNMSMQSFRQMAFRKLSETYEKVKHKYISKGDMKIMQKNMGKKKQKLVNLQHIHALHDANSKKQFQNKGIRDKNFINMIKTCTNDIKSFKQMSFLPSSIIRSKHGRRRSMNFGCKSLIHNLAVASSTMSGRKTSAMSHRSYSSQHIESLIKKYCKSGTNTRRKLDTDIEERRKQKQDMKNYFCGLFTSQREPQTERRSLQTQQTKHRSSMRL